LNPGISWNAAKIHPRKGGWEERTNGISKGLAFEKLKIPPIPSSCRSFQPGNNPIATIREGEDPPTWSETP
jgi:hypothetical protein